MPEDSRQERHFDRETEKRNRRNFVVMVAAFAGLAMAGGALLAWWIISPPDEDRPPPISNAEPEPPDPSGFDPFDDGDEPEPEPERPKPTVKRKLNSGDVDSGLRRIQAALNACAVKHGAIDGTRVGVDFSIKPNGRVSDSFSRPPHKTPLGNCVANVIKTKGKFKKTQNGLGDIRRTITLRRTSG